MFIYTIYNNEITRLLNSEADSIPIFLSVDETCHAILNDNKDGCESTIEIKIKSSITLDPYQEQIFALI